MERDDECRPAFFVCDYSTLVYEKWLFRIFMHPICNIDVFESVLGEQRNECGLIRYEIRFVE